MSETGCVEGSWSLANHEELIGSDHSYVKEGTRYSDISANTKGITNNPWWHGSYHVNYIAAYIYATRMAEQLGKGKSESSAANVSGLSANQINSLQNDVYLWAENTPKYTKGQKRAFVWGMAIHNAADVFAHSVYIKSGNEWCHLAHGGTHNKKKYNDYADNVKRYEARYTAAKKVVKKIIDKYDAKNGAGSYVEFNEMTTVAKTFRLRYLCDYIKATNSSANTNGFKDYSVSSGVFNEYWAG